MDFEQLSCDDRVAAFMRQLLESYNLMRGKHKDEANYVFWDAVALAALDESQKISYELQISEKQRKMELPIGIPFHVFSDPPCCKIGCGGSAMFVMEKLIEMYGTSFQEMRILFVPAGGYSQRLPSHSVLGKLFSPVPYGYPMYQMIDLILAVYLPFVKRMSPGVLLASSDAMISYYIEEKDDWSFLNTGFTALAHPSTVDVGKHHGVYVLPRQNQHTGNCFMSSCVQVLQKASEQLLWESGAVMESIDLGYGKKEDIVYSDSIFFFDTDIAVKLANFFTKIKPLNFEISSYGDFLQPLGILSNPYYIQSDKEEVHRVRMQLYELLHGTHLHVIGLKHSKFFHLGSMSEYIDNYCGKNKFFKHFFCEKFVCSSSVPRESPVAQNDGTILHSILHADSQVCQKSIVEYCDFSVPVHISENCILSNCKLSESVGLKLPVDIPANMLIHTIAIFGGYVTICFSINENIKETFEFEKKQNLSFLNINFGTVLNKFLGHSMFDCDGRNKSVSLWHAKLFPVCSTMEESFIQTLLLVRVICGYYKPECFWQACSHTNFLSMEDVLKLKNIKQMLLYREKLSDKLSSLACS